MRSLGKFLFLWILILIGPTLSSPMFGIGKSTPVPAHASGTPKPSRWQFGKYRKWKKAETTRMGQEANGKTKKVEEAEVVPPPKPQKEIQPEPPKDTRTQAQREQDSYNEWFANWERLTGEPPTFKDRIGDLSEAEWSGRLTYAGSRYEITKETTPFFFPDPPKSKIKAEFQSGVIPAT